MTSNNPDWFGDTPVIGDLPTEQIASKLSELGDSEMGDELRASESSVRAEQFSILDPIRQLFTRFVATVHACGFIALKRDGQNSDAILPVSKATPEPSLVGEKLKITLDGLHIAKYPGFGRHSVLFDFALQSQGSDTRIFHYNAKFSAADGETVPVRNFPLFYDLTSNASGIIFGFQTVNVSSSFNEGLLGFLDREDFKQGLSLAISATPLLGQVSEMATSLTRWLAGQSKNAKVQEFRQGLDFSGSRLGGALAEGSYIVVQIPIENQHEWNWDDWKIDETLARIVSRDDSNTTLDFNHLIFGVQRLT